MEQHISFICGFVFAICLIVGGISLWTLLNFGYVDTTKKSSGTNDNEKDTLNKNLRVYKGPFELLIYSEYRGNAKFKHSIKVKVFRITVFDTFHSTAINDDGSFYIRGFENSRDISKPFEQSFLNR